MKTIQEKYGLTEGQFKAMVKDGIISTTFPRYEEIIIHYKANLSKGSGEAVHLTCEKFNVSKSTVYEIIARLR